MNYTIPFEKVSAGDIALVGGKGANLGEMTCAGLPVPSGFCVTTAAFRLFMNVSGATEQLYATLDGLAADDVQGVRVAGEDIRAKLRHVPIPAAVSADFLKAWEASGKEHPYAVRSSATAEDLPTASFAGQQDTFLNVRGSDELLDKLRACWVSLFTDRAILYRMQNDFAHREVALSVVVQRMLQPQVSGILFTADPVSGHRQIATIDASYGLGEALVQGLVTPDHYRVNKRNGEILAANVADKQLAIQPDPAGGVVEQQLAPAQRNARVLDDMQVGTITELGKRVEAHYGQPQDIEWSLQDGELFLLQTRPITSLYPLPKPPPPDDALRVFISLSHAQVMTDPMPPLSISIWRLLLPFGISDSPGKLNPYVCSAGGRMYVDISPLLHHPVAKHMLSRFLNVADVLIANAVKTLIQRDEFKNSAVQLTDKVHTPRLLRWVLPILLQGMARLWILPPEGAIEEINQRLDAYLQANRARIEKASPGAERLRLVQDWLGRIFIEAALPLPPYLVAGVFANGLVGRLTHGRAEQSDLNALGRGLEGNVTTMMDLEVGDLADKARESPELVAQLRSGQASLDTLADLPGSGPFLSALAAFLERYGMRGPAEIDLSRARWSDDPSSLFQAIAGSLYIEEVGRHRVYHQRLVAEGQAAATRLVAVARAGPLGWIRAALVRRLVRVTRELLPIREHPKFMLVRAMHIAKQAILAGAAMLVEQGRLAMQDDVWFLTLPELVAALEDQDEELKTRIATRQEAHVQAAHLTPPRVMTSLGEIPAVRYERDDLSPGALPGTSVSAGVVEGVARVILDPSAEVLNVGEILVAPFTDPGWTPLFINAAGLVMEVGGVMTHGSVVAREYGIPAVVGVLNATKRIQTGQQICVDGDAGYVRVLEK